MGLPDLPSDLPVPLLSTRGIRAPPQLPADAPVLNIPHPGKIRVLPLFWDELNGARLDRVDGGFRYVLSTYHCGVSRLNDRPERSPLALQYMRLNLLRARIKLLCDERTRVETIQSVKTLGTVNLCVGGQNIDLGQLVSFAHRVIVEVIAGVILTHPDPPGSA